MLGGRNFGLFVQCVDMVDMCSEGAILAWLHRECAGIHPTVLSQGVATTDWKSEGHHSRVKICFSMGCHDRVEICWCGFETCSIVIFCVSRV